jgi:hypothetical protein
MTIDDLLSENNRLRQETLCQQIEVQRLREEVEGLKKFIPFKPNMTYYAYHKPTEESWVILGVDIKNNRVCAAGWPATIGNISDCVDFEEREYISQEELDYRNKTFGNNWF